MLILKRAMRRVCRVSVLGFAVAVSGKHSLARQLMVEIGDAVGHNGRHHGGVLLIAGILAVKDVVFGVPDFAVAEVGAVNVGQTEIVCWHSLHGKYRSVVAAELRGAFARLGHGHLEGKIGIDARNGLAYLFHIIGHSCGNGYPHGRLRTAVAVEYQRYLVKLFFVFLAVGLRSEQSEFLGRECHKAYGAPGLRSCGCKQASSIGPMPVPQSMAPVPTS